MALGLLALLLGLPLTLIAAGQLGFLAGRAPADLGVREGKLRPPSPTANSVSSQAALHADAPTSARIEALPLRGDAQASLARLRAVLEGMDGVRIAEAGPGYLHAEARTRWLGFVDDLEFWVDAQARVIHLRSASRLGRRDFGVNRARVEAVRARYLAGG